jgi:FkbM family methyltransferase
MNLDSRFEMEYASGFYEPMIEALLLSSLKAGGVFYDVGAHIGLFSLLAARIVGQTGSVFAFEADPENAERIQEHRRRNGLDNIQVIPSAVWSSAGRLTFARASANSSRNQGAVTVSAANEKTNTIQIEAVTLDAFAQEHLPPTLVKIDVEGGEAAVLEGSEELFKSKSPMLICEVHNQEAANYVIRWLESNQYGFRWIEETTGFPRHLWAKHEP